MKSFPVGNISLLAATFLTALCLGAGGANLSFSPIALMALFLLGTTLHYFIAYKTLFGKNHIGWTKKKDRHPMSEIFVIFKYDFTGSIHIHVMSAGYATGILLMTPEWRSIQTFFFIIFCSWLIAFFGCCVGVLIGRFTVD